MSTTTAKRQGTPTSEVDRPGSHRQHEVLRLLPAPLLIIVLVFLGALVLIPVLYIFLASVNSDIGVANGEFWPSTVTFENYSKIWTSVGLANGLANSILVAGATAVVSAALSVSTAFVLVRYTFRGRLTILRGLLALQSVPGTLMVLPVFVLYASIHFAITGETKVEPAPLVSAARLCVATSRAVKRTGRVRCFIIGPRLAARARSRCGLCHKDVLARCSLARPRHPLQWPSKMRTNQPAGASNRTSPRRKSGFIPARDALRRGQDQVAPARRRC